MGDQANKKRAVLTVVLLVGLLIVSGISLPVGTAANSETMTDSYQFSLGPGKAETWEFWIYEAGTITITAQWTGPSQMHIYLYGPVQQDPYLDTSGTSPMTKTFTVTSQILAAGQQQWKWEVKLGNRNETTAANGTISLTYPKSLPKINEFKAETRSAYPVPLVQAAGTPMYAAWPGQEFELSWSLGGVRNDVTLTYGCPPVAPEMPPGVATDCAVTTHSVAGQQSSSEMIGDQGGIYTLKVTNKHGSVEAKIIVLPIVLVGYHNAVCIGCAPCRNCGKTPQATQLGNLLKEIDQKCNGGCIRNNTNLDRFNDPYLRGNMTNDMLAKMTTVSLYASDAYLPNVAPGTKCTGSIYGYTPSDKSYILLCLEQGASGLTLLHELEHYTDPNTTECRAAWVAQYCYGCPAGGCLVLHALIN